MTMARTDNDTWDLTSSVGATATMVAAARAVATRQDDALISDPFAEPLVRAVGVDFFTRLASGGLGLEDLDTGNQTMGLARMTDNMAARTKFFDDFFLEAGRAGIRQAVILASGLDARAYRLAWADGTVVYEIDQPGVIEFKTTTMGSLGADPTAELRTVAIDLRYDWPTALKAAGFDPSAPTAWSAEGLLGYLPPEAQDQLLDTVTALSAPGSRFAVECGPTSIPEAERENVVERMRQASQQWRDHGFDLDFSELVYIGDRNDPGTYLADRGWRVTRRTVDELLADNGRPRPPADDEMGNLGEMAYLTGILGS
ncbi:class I SAM-dependent methyltransferase [Mycolicibacterium phlei]|nr:class I SAM-dependent methyltransferase [Mycolicibacterium phlei]KXW79313.1 SAM-dependent methyltransferase [Mycolicibacterium phlei DSM 43071]